MTARCPICDRPRNPECTEKHLPYAIKAHEERRQDYTDRLVREWAEVEAYQKEVRDEHTNDGTGA